MSKQNKVNKTNYVQAGRLTPDEAARERKRQTDISAHAKDKGKVRAPRAASASAKATARSSGRGASRPRSAPEE